MKTASKTKQPIIEDYIVNNSTKLFLDDPDQFLKTFDAKYFNNQKIISTLVKDIDTKGKRIGTVSAVGQIYDLGEWVVKIAKSCPSGVDINQQIPVIRKMCEQANNGDVIYRVPSSYNNKMMLSAPSYITESLIGILLWNNLSKKNTPSFPRVLGFQYNTENVEKPIYTVMEKLTPLIPRIKNDSIGVIQTCFQVTYGLASAQLSNKFCHGDLHGENVMARVKDIDNIYCYGLGNGNYVYIKSRFEPVIIDFGWSRLETDGTVIAPLTNFGPMGDDKTMKNFQVDILNFFEFNPYVDLLSFMYFLVTTLDDKEDLNISRDLKITLLAGLLKLDINAPLDQLELEISAILTRILININGNIYWRPNYSEISTYDKANNKYPPCTPQEYLISLSTIMSREQLDRRVDKQNPASVSAFLDKYGFFVSNSSKSVGGKITRFDLPTKSKRMDITYYPSQLNQLPSYTFDNINVQTQISNDVYVHVAFIDQNNGIKNGYKFYIDCCRVDIRDLLRSTTIKSGIAINASFFQINGNYTPIGYFKTDDVIINNEISSKYAKYYGHLGILRNGGKLGISKYGENLSKYDQIVTVGPLLVSGGKIVFDESDVDTMVGKQHIFKCRQPTTNDESQSKYLGRPDGTFETNCSAIGPGEFSHANNPNPRSALVIDNKGTVIFIYAEGRGRRGKGLDLVNLAKICSEMGAVDAINLDGGGSSQMVWRGSGDTLIHQSNPMHDFAYPVGSVISFAKK